MGRKRSQRQESGRRRSPTPEASDPAARQRRWLVFPALALLLLGVAASVYLLRLDLLVRSPDGPPMDAFCNISARVNCITVATSSYSAFLGIPVALYGLEFFGLLTILVLLSATRGWPLVRWDSLLFFAALMALPIVGVLAWIAAFRIHSVCIVCVAVYSTVVLLLLLLGVAGRRRLGGLAVDGLRELLSNLARPGVSVAVVTVSLAGLSQFFWAPRLLHASPERSTASAPWEGLPTSGLTIGPAGAPLKIEEFTDFQCPHCGKAHEVMIEVLRRFPGKVHLIHRDFPLDMSCNAKVQHRMHNNACRAAYYARCASQQGKYWRLEGLLFANRERLDEANLRTLGVEAGVDLQQLETCVRSARTQQAILDDINEGLQRGITGTPTFFVNGEKVVGPQRFEFWEQRIMRLEGK
jgi:uncharacterized membrane protein/predicted DsbA family dithiol-disulfide isomerase